MHNADGCRGAQGVLDIRSGHRGGWLSEQETEAGKGALANTTYPMSLPVAYLGCRFMSISGYV